MADVPINAFHKYPVDPLTQHLIQCLMMQIKSKELNGISRVSSEDTYQDENTVAHVFERYKYVDIRILFVQCNIIYIYDRMLTNA